MPSNKTMDTGEEPDMRAIESIQKALDAIESGLGDKLDIPSLAASVSLSPFYFQRLFKSAVGHNVEDYIKLRRLARAADLIKSGAGITAAAVECGFESASHFSRSFTEAYGMTPSAYQSGKPPLFHVMKPDILLMNRNLGIGELYVAGGMVLQIDVRHQEETHLIGIDVFCPIGIGTPGVDNPGIAWDRFHPAKSRVPNRCEPREELGISYCPADRPCEGGFYYLAATRVAQPGPVPDGMVAYTLPAGLYACCIYQNESFEAGVSANLKSAIDYLGKWQAENGYAMDGWFEAEYYGPTAFAEPYQIEIRHLVRKA